jgi:hypothetical protein
MELAAALISSLQVCSASRHARGGRGAFCYAAELTLLQHRQRDQVAVLKSCRAAFLSSALVYPCQESVNIYYRSESFCWLICGSGSLAIMRS